VLIPFCAAYLDQGFANWEMPRREAGLYATFLSLYGESLAAPSHWMALVQREARRLSGGHISPLESIQESLGIFVGAAEERDKFLTRTLLALRGWAGMIHQMETNAEWTPHPAPSGSLVEFLAVRLILDRLATATLSREYLNFNSPLHEL